MKERIKNQTLLNKVITPEEAAKLIKDKMKIAISGFALFGEPTLFLKKLAERGNKESFSIDLYTGASIGSEGDGSMVEADLINKRIPYQAHPILRSEINNHHVNYIDEHLSQTGETLRQGIYGPIDYTIIEATKITENGELILSGSVGNTPIFAEKAKHIIIEINLNLPEEYEGLHDIYIPNDQGKRQEIPLMHAEDRIGSPGLKIDLDKVCGVIISEENDTPTPLFEPNQATEQIASNLLNFFDDEIEAKRLTKELAPLQSGVGSVANAVLNGMKDCHFRDIIVSSEVLQDGMFDLIEAGVVKFVSTTALALSEKRYETLAEDLKKHRNKILMRPQEISNNPEVIRRLGVIAINTAIEVDIYGNVNSTHLNGSHIMNGIGGSGDFTRNARISIFVTQSIAKDGKISTIVTFASHIDHPNNDIDLIVTEQVYADLRGLNPRETAKSIINNCMHPTYKQQAFNYLNKALLDGGNTPHILPEAFDWHINLQEKGTMLLD